jgi:hypothetical protein
MEKNQDSYSERVNDSNRNKRRRRLGPKRLLSGSGSMSKVLVGRFNVKISGQHYNCQQELGFTPGFGLINAKKTLIAVNRKSDFFRILPNAAKAGRRQRSGAEGETEIGDRDPGNGFQFGHIQHDAFR